MDVWYTPERLALYQEIGQRRMARHERREREAKRRQARSDAFEALKIAALSLLAVLGFYCWLLMATV